MMVRSRLVVSTIATLVALTAAGCTSGHSASYGYGYGPRVEVSSENLADAPTEIKVYPVHIGAGDGSGALAYVRLLADRRQQIRRERMAAADSAGRDLQ